MRRHGFLLAMLFFSAVLCAEPQEIAVVKSNLSASGTNTYYPLTNVYVTVTGRVTSPFLSVSDDTTIFIQDLSAGLKVQSTGVDFELETDNDTFGLGVEVTVYGRIQQENGIRMIRPEYYEAGAPENDAFDFYISNTNAAPVTPALVTVAQLVAAGESYEGSLVRITNVTMNAVDWTYGEDNVGTVVSDATASITMLIDKDTDIAGQLPPTNAFDVVGVAVQFDTSAIPSNGYQILPRYYSDLSQSVGPQPPVISVSSTSYAAKTTRELSFFVVGQDRNAADSLSFSTNGTPAGSTFSNVGPRSARFAWTPSLSDAETTNVVTFEVSDGTSTDAVDVAVIVGGLYPTGFAWINEIHYDDDGTDAGEGVELAGAAGIDLTQYDLVFYNGNGNAAYMTFNCTNSIDDEGSGYGAIWFAIPNIQNGSPDAVALVHDTQGVLDFLSYEGTMIASGGVANGITSFDMGVAETSDNYDETKSLQLTGSGTNYEAFSWTGPIAETKGSLNLPGQIVGTQTFANIEYSGLALNPGAPETNEAFYIQVTIAANSEAANLAPAGYYQMNGGGFSNIVMTHQGSGLYRTSSQIPGQPDGTVIDYYVRTTFDGPGTNSPAYTSTNTYTVKGVIAGSLDISGYKLLQQNSALTYTFPAGTFVAPTGYVVIARDAGQAAFETFWGVSLGRRVTFINGSNGMPQINGAEIYTLEDATAAVLDGPTPAGVNPSGNSVQRNSASADSTLVASWTEVASTNGNPGGGGVGPGTEGLVINEFSDALGTGNYIYEFVELYYDSSPVGISSNEAPTLRLSPDENSKTTVVSNGVAFTVYAEQVLGDTGQSTHLAASNLPPGAVWSDKTAAAPVSNDFSWVPSATGVYAVTFHAWDTDGAATPETVTITVNPAPVVGVCEVILSEYIEGSSNEKAVEIYNGTDSLVDLAAGQYYLMLYNNGSTDASYTHALTGTVASGSAYVIVNNPASATLKAYADQLNDLFFNGDDAVVLRSGGTNGPVVDSIGRVGEDPGSYWGTASDNTANHTLRRMSGIGSGDKIPDDAFDPATEWTFFDVDTFDNLGSHTSDCPSGSGGDTDSDGISDDYELKYSGSVTGLTASADIDSDGWINLDEYIADTIPTNGLSFYDPDVTNATGAATMQIIAGPPTTNSRVYDVFYTTDLVTDGSWTPMNFDVPGEADGSALTLTVTNDVEGRVYRSGVKVP
ncbi:MAG: lamin tail domain-containing protein [Verrucomicrobia bacterium]|nr:lamin tail domain-containing protein [Verrucomicrobiota bacterium]